MDEDDPDSADGARNLACAHFIACHGVRCDGVDADAGYTLDRVIVHVRPRDGNGFPFRVARLFVFAQLYGTPGDYTLHVRLLRVRAVEGEDVIETRRDFAPQAIAISGENYVECFALGFSDVWFTEPGVYEFQLWADGFDEPLARERIQARE